MIDDYKVHASHCCKWHGCRYGDKNCPVVNGEIEQLWLCDDCYEEMDKADYYTSVIARLPKMYEFRLKAQKRYFEEALKEAKGE